MNLQSLRQTREIRYSSSGANQSPGTVATVLHTIIDRKQAMSLDVGRGEVVSKRVGVSMSSGSGHTLRRVR